MFQIADRLVIIYISQYRYLTMGHVEFIGPPGAGKTSVYTSLANSDGWYRPTPEEACRRRILDMANPKRRLCYRAIPTSVRSFLNSELFTYRYRHHARERFGEQRPEALQEILLGTGTVEYQPDKLTRLMEELIERYQMGVETVREH